MSRQAAIMLMLVLWLSQAAAAVSDSADTQKSQGSKGITVDDLGRGLKSAAKNIEKEIPKIGPAIAETVKKITGKDSEKQKAQSPEKRER